MENIKYEHNYGGDTYGKVVEEDGKFQCYATPVYGGEFQKEGNPFLSLDEAIIYLKSFS